MCLITQTKFLGFNFINKESPHFYDEYFRFIIQYLNIKNNDHRIHEYKIVFRVDL